MTEPAKERLFLAVALDEATKAVLGAHVESHAGPGLPGRVVRPENWHITLRFLGWTTPVQRDGVLRAVDEAELPSPFTMRFAGLGAFPRERRATVLWIGVDRGNDELAALAGACESAAQGTGFRPEERPYHPHLTLSRIRPHQDVTPLVERFPACPVEMPVPAITLFRSHLQRGGAVYEEVDTIEL